MALTAQQLAQEMATLEAQTAAIAQEARQIYGEYLAELSHTAATLLTTVCYDLCTQMHPEEFLHLSLRDREQLQQAVREQSQQLRNSLSLAQLFPVSAENPTAQPSPSTREADIDSAEVENSHGGGDPSPPGDTPTRSVLMPNHNTAIAFTSQGGDSVAGGSERDAILDRPSFMGEENGAQFEFDPDFEPPPAEDRHLPLSLVSNQEVDISPGVLASALAAEGESAARDGGRSVFLHLPPPSGGTALPAEALQDPHELFRWIERMERGISQRLRQSSQRMTRILEKSKILNNQLPNGLLEAASRPKHSESDRGLAQQPHVLSLSLNAADKEAKNSREQPIQIIAIYLRLAEIEFSAPHVMAWRNQLRSLDKRLKTLAKAYQQTKRAQQIAEAQSLWRSSWIHDPDT